MIRFLEECRSWPLIMMICLVCITLDFRVNEMLEIFNFLIFYQEHWVTGPQVRPPRSPRPKTETYDFDDANGAIQFPD